VKVLFVVNEGSFFLSHRLALAEEARRVGMQVMVVCGAGTGEDDVRAAQIEARTVPLSRSGFNPLEEFRSVRALYRVYREERPDLVHHVTIKPVLYGTTAARWSGVPAVVNAVPGMGFVFTRRGPWAAIRRAFVNLLYRLAMTHPNMRVIFQNSEDMQGFIGSAIVDRAHTMLIRGSGVDLSKFQHKPEPEGAVTFLLVGRMLRHKGVAEFVAAAQQIKIKYPDWRFRLAGDVDPGNPASLTHDEMVAWDRAGDVEWLGHRDDVATLMSEAHVVCLPSYREGLPKTLLEAAASGRPMIASDIAGCREVVRSGVNGLIVPARTVGPLRDAMLQLGQDGELRQRFGRAARQKAEAVFSVEDVVKHTFRVYQQLQSQ
jgi:glycosyltransferase involved in cell wall biosynthesis